MNPTFLLALLYCYANLNNIVLEGHVKDTKRYTQPVCQKYLEEISTTIENADDEAYDLAQDKIIKLFEGEIGTEVLGENFEGASLCPLFKEYKVFCPFGPSETEAAAEEETEHAKVIEDIATKAEQERTKFLTDFRKDLKTKLNEIVKAFDIIDYEAGKIIEKRASAMEDKMKASNDDVKTKLKDLSDALKTNNQNIIDYVRKQLAEAIASAEAASKRKEGDWKGVGASIADQLDKKVKQIVGLLDFKTFDLTTKFINGSSILNMGETLEKEQSMISQNGKWQAWLQGDRNFVIYDISGLPRKTSVWNSYSQTNWAGNFKLKLETNGAFVMRDQNGWEIWRMSPQGYGYGTASYMELTNEGALVLRNDQGKTIQTADRRGAVGNPIAFENAKRYNSEL